MPRLAVSISKNYAQQKTDAGGRRIRAVQGVRIVGERDKPSLFDRLFFKVTVFLALLAMASMSLAIWRLFNFPH
jgi:hypothetical protein